MKIIISPSKRQNRNLDLNYPIKDPLYEDKMKELYNYIHTLSREELSKRLKVKGKLLEKTYKRYKAMKPEDRNHSIATYNGLVFKNIDLESYGKKECDFMERHLCILSAFYGVLTPFTGINQYRLDMKSKLEEINLYNFWNKSVESFFKEESLIINLASKEFSKIIKDKTIRNRMVNILFKEKQKDGKLRVVAARAKKARGLMVDYIIKNKIQTVHELKAFNGLAYTFDEALSEGHKLFFVK